jgi:hypothetical protein
MLAAVPYVGGSLQVIVEDVRARREAQAAVTLNEIADKSGGAEELGRRLSADPVLEALFVNGVEAALRTGYEAKRRLLSKAVSQAVLDDAKVDESQLIVEALSQLDVPHVRALEKMARESQEKGSDPAAWGWGQSEAWGQEHAAIKAALIRTGTAKGSSNAPVAGAGRQEGITEFGIALVEELHASQPA